MRFLLDTNVLVHLTNKSRGFDRVRGLDVADWTAAPMAR